MELLPTISFSPCATSRLISKKSDNNKLGKRIFIPKPPFTASRRSYSPDAGCVKKTVPAAM